jgi:hypothetical protein
MYSFPFEQTLEFTFQVEVVVIKVPNSSFYFKLPILVTILPFNHPGIVMLWNIYLWKWERKNLQDDTKFLVTDSQWMLRYSIGENTFCSQ